MEKKLALGMQNIHLSVKQKREQKLAMANSHTQGLDWHKNVTLNNLWEEYVDDLMFSAGIGVGYGKWLLEAYTTRSKPISDIAKDKV